MKGFYSKLLFVTALTLFSSTRAPLASGPSETAKDGGAEYARWARELSGEPASPPSEARRHLAALPGLDERLRQELAHGNVRQALAVIRALKRSELLDRLLPLAAADSTGEVYETLIVIQTPRTASATTTAVLGQLAGSVRTMSPAALVTGLELLAVNQAHIPAPALDALLEHESYEVREAVLAYIGSSLAYRGPASDTSGASPGARNFKDRKIYYRALGHAMASHPYQLRSQALTIAGRLSAPELIAASLPFATCSEDPNPGVRRLCRQIQARTKKGPRR